MISTEAADRNHRGISLVGYLVGVSAATVAFFLMVLIPLALPQDAPPDAYGALFLFVILSPALCTFNVAIGAGPFYLMRRSAPGDPATRLAYVLACSPLLAILCVVGDVALARPGSQSIYFYTPPHIFHGRLSHAV